MKKLIQNLLLCTFLCFCAVMASAQQKNVTGTVKDNNGVPVANATVLVKGTKMGTSTDANGHFSISVKGPNSILVISSVTYKTSEVAVGDKSDIAINIGVSTTTALNEVVVTAFGVKRKSNTLGYSSTTIGGQEIDRTNTINPITALQGKVAGVSVNVMSASGVQTSPYIQIRGAAVLGGNNQPIFVIDGNVLQNNLFDADNTNSGSQLKDLNPDDYESITVLKGAAATALYGSRGINGAVVITTKSGRGSKGIGVEFNSTASVTDVYAPFMKLQNEFGMGTYVREGAFRPDGTQNYANANWGPAFDGTMHPAPWNPNIQVPYVAQPNNWKTFYQNGNYINNNVALSGASDKTHYRLSYSNTTNNGILPKNGLKRNAVDLKIGGQMNKVFSYEVGINYANTITKNEYNQGRYAWPGGGNIGFNSYYLPRNINFQAWHATYRNPDNSIALNDNILGGTIISGFSALDKNNYSQIENSVLAYTLITAQVNPWLDLSARGNVNYLKDFNETKNYGNSQYNAGGQFAAGGSYSTNYEALFMAHAKAHADNNNLSIDARLFNDIYGNLLGESYNASTQGGLQIPNLFVLSNSVNDIGKNGGYSYSYSPPSTLTVGIAAAVDLTYKEYLTLGLTARNDWLSTLTYPANNPGQNNNSVFYPSANVSYNFRENMQSSIPNWLSTGRVWGNIGFTGNSGVAGAYSTGLGYNPNSIVNQYGQTITTANPINANIRPNPNLKPQIQRGIEFGTDLGFFNDLVHVNFDWYTNNTFNQLMQLPGIPETGYNTLYINAGNIRNQGVELELNVTPVRSRDWTLDLGLNLAHNASKVIKLAPGITSFQNTGGYEGVVVNSYQGGAYGILQANGGGSFQLDPKTGYPIIETTPNSTNGAPDTVNFANYQYMYDTAQLVNVGKNGAPARIQPDLTGGFMVNLRYKNFSLFTQIDGRLGGYIYSESYAYAMGAGTPLTSLKYRDKAHGGVARTNSYTGQTVYDGAVPNAVFAAGQTSTLKPGVNIGGLTFKQAYDQGLVESWYAPAYYDGGYGYNGTYDWENGFNYNGDIAKESWLMLREISLSYQLPSAFIKKIKAIQGAKLTLSVRNVGYLYNSLPDKQNPASVESNDPTSPFITGGVPFERNYSVSLNLRF